MITQHVVLHVVLVAFTVLYIAMVWESYKDHGATQKGIIARNTVEK